MERFKSLSLARPWTAAMTAGLMASMTWLPQAARGELVYEDSPAAAAAAAPSADAVRAEERGVLRQALSSSERARATRQAQVAVPAQAPAAQQVVIQAPAPVAVAPQTQTFAAEAPVVAEAAPEAAPARQGDSVEDLRNMNKTELMRRARVREELRNEDALQERLEELRLRDEKRRTDQILGVAGASGSTAATGAAGSAVNLPAPLYGQVQEEAVSAPVTERPGQAPRSPQMVAPAQAVAGPSGGPQLAGISSMNSADQVSPSTMTASMDLDKPKDKSVFYVMPRAGLGAMSNSGGYDVSPKYAGGVSVGVATSEFLSFELGYTYAEYGVNIGSSNPFVQQIQGMQNYYGNGQNSNTLAYKQNVVDIGMKLHLMDSSSRVRPFVGGGGAWSKGFINYDQQILNNLKQSYPGFQNTPLMNDYELTSYMGYISGGLDVKMSQNITLDFMAKYYAVLSSSENSNLLNYAFYNPNLATQSPEKQAVGGSMGKTNFFTLMGGVSFAF